MYRATTADRANAPPSSAPCPPAPPALPALPALDVAVRRCARVIYGATAFVALLAVSATVLRVGLGVAHGPLDVIGLLDPRGESTLPAWFTSALLLGAAALLAAVGWINVARRAPFARHWLCLAVIFLAMSADECVALHERAAWPVERIFKLKGPFLYGWVIPALVFVAAVGLSYVNFLRHLPRTTRRRFVFAGAIYVTGALGMEMLEGAHATGRGNETGAYAAMVVVEEVLEMSGVALFVCAVLAYVRDAWGGVALRFIPATATALTMTPVPAPRISDAAAPLVMARRGVTAVPSGSPPPDPAGPPRPARRDRVVA